jgi:hypothetical protein
MRYRRPHHWRRLLILFSSAQTLSGCATSPGKLNVDLTAIKECQKLGGPVPVPEITRKSDYRVLSAQALGQLHKANSGAEQRTGCEDRVVDDYANAGK